MFAASSALVAALAVAGAGGVVGLSARWPHADEAAFPSRQASPAVANPVKTANIEEPAQPATHQQMVALLKRIADESSETHPFLANRPARDLRAKLATLDTRTPDADRWLVHMDLGEAEMRLGNLPAAIEQFSRARDIVTRAGGGATLGPWIGSNYFRLGAAFLRLGESENCALHAGATSCILPLRGESLHRQREPSTQALINFAAALETEPNSSLGLSTRWLLNIAHMTLGTYPQQVPDALLIPPKAFESEEPFPRFENIAPKLGLDAFNLSGGAIADDLDGDGYLDVMVSTWDTRGQIRFFHNEGNGRFSDRTRTAGLTGILGGLNLVQADYDNDGDIDVLVLRGAWLAEHGQHPNSLLRNNGRGTFTDVTFDAGLGNVHYPTQTAAFADYDNDGDLDVYVGNESSPSMPSPSQLFRNNGNGTFTDVARTAGVTNDRFAKGVTWGDYNGDRWMDLYVSNRGAVNRLYHNNSDGTFVDVAVPLGVGGPIDSFPTWFWDVDNDGVLDLYVAAYAAGIDHLAASALGLPLDIEMAKLYRGDGKGRFADVSADYNLVRPNAPMGSNFGDLDNDGYLDFYLGTGYPAIHNIMPNVMYHNRGGKRFLDVSYAGGFAHLQKGHAVVFADLDHDGDQDVFEQMGGAYPVDLATNVLFENPGFKHHWITVQLVGSRSNRSAIGARLRAEIVEGDTRRSVYRHVNSGGSFGANPLRQTLGLGAASRIDVLEVFWPRTGETQTFRDVPVDRAIRIVEGEDAWTTLPVKRFKLSGRAAP